MGQIQAKCEQIKYLPISPELVAKLSEVYLAKGVNATTAIEGNTLTEQEVLKIRRQELQVQPSHEYLQREVENSYAAFESIRQEVSENPWSPLTVERICELHALVFDGLAKPDMDDPGQLRSRKVVVGNYKPPEPQYCHDLLVNFCDWLEEFLEVKSSPGTPEASAEQFARAVFAAVMSHLYLLLIHPFADGNGRLSRAIEARILLVSGIPTMSTQLLSNHYNQTRPRYYQLLDTISLSRKFPAEKFIGYALEGFSEQLDTQLEDFENENIRLLMAGHIQKEFTGQTKPLQLRQKELATALAFRPEPVPPHAVPSLTPLLAKYYEKKTLKSVSRDLNALSRLGIINLTLFGVEINRNLFAQGGSVSQGGLASQSDPV